jgi:hypothetical protein
VVTVFAFGQNSLARSRTLRGNQRGAQPGMKKQPAIEKGSSIETTTILIVSPVEEDHLSVQAIVSHPTYSTWILFNARDLVSAFALLQQHDIGVVVCEHELRHGTWIDMLKHLHAMPTAPH